MGMRFDILAPKQSGREYIVNMVKAAAARNRRREEAAAQATTAQPTMTAPQAERTTDMLSTLEANNIALTAKHNRLAAENAQLLQQQASRLHQSQAARAHQRRAPKTTALEVFEAAVGEHVARGMDHARAKSKVIHDRPELHAQILAEANPGHEAAAVLCAT